MLAVEFGRHRRSCACRLQPSWNTRAPVPGQMQRCPGMRCAVHEAMSRDVVTRIKAVEVHAHLRQLIAPEMCERAPRLIARTPRAFLAERQLELIARGELGGACTVTTLCGSV